MPRVRMLLASLLSGSLAAATLSGCGGKSKNDDYEPPPAVASNTQAPPVTPKTEPPKIGDSDPKDPTPMPPPVAKFPVTPLPQVPMPPLPGPKDPPDPKDPPAKNPPPMPFMPPPPPDMAKEPEKKDPKEPFKWPTSLYGRPMAEFIRDINDPDPAIREMALRTLPGFGPNALEPATKIVLRHMQVANEKDPGVRAAAFEAVGALAQFGKDGGLDKESDTNEAIRILYNAADAGGATRLHAVNTLASFGPKAEIAIPFLVGGNMTVLEPAYETRRAIATTLGAISFNKEKGPNQQALHCLADVLIKDRSAAVRLAAYQSIVLLGPPYLPPAPIVPGKPKPAMKVDEKAVEGYVKLIKSRLLPYKAEPGTKEPESPTGLMERDRQVEIFARFTLMRFELKEINDENVKGITKYIVVENKDSGPKLQALNALGMMGEFAARAIDDVAKALNDEDPRVVTTAVSVLVAMGKKAEPALDLLEKLKTRGSKEGEKDAKDYPRKYYEDLAKEAIKAIKEAKPPPKLP